MSPIYYNSELKKITAQLTKGGRLDGIRGRGGEDQRRTTADDWRASEAESRTKSEPAARGKGGRHQVRTTGEHQRQARRRGSETATASEADDWRASEPRRHQKEATAHRCGEDQRRTTGEHQRREPQTRRHPHQVERLQALKTSQTSENPRLAADLAPSQPPAGCTVSTP